MDIIKNDKKYLASTYNRQPLEIVKGDGSFVYGKDGKKYIDFGTGIAVNGLGTGDKKWLKAVTKQLKTLAHTSNLYYSEPCVKLAKKLCEKTGLKKVFFSNSGAEANECAIKVARKYSFDKYGDGRNEIITLKNSFHGRTLTTISATGQDVFHTYFMPFTQGFKFAEPNKDSISENLTKNTCAIMIELVQGEGGVIALDKEFVTWLSELCKKKDILLIVDEVQTGNGRTGSLYAYMQYGILPDIVTTAKGLGNGLPIGATMLGAKVKETLTYGTHGSTFGGNLVACAGAIAVIDSLTDELLSEVTKKSEYIIKELSAVNGVKGVTGLGFMLGISCENAKTVVETCRERGLLVLTAKDKVRLLPPLNVSWETLKQAVEILKGALEK